MAVGGRRRRRHRLVVVEVIGGGVPVAVKVIAEHLLPACAHTHARIALHTKYWSGV